MSAMVTSRLRNNPKGRRRRERRLRLETLEQRLLLTAGDLDTTFGPFGNGRIVTDFGGGDVAVGMTLQPDEKILVAGSTAFQGFSLVRYLPDGDLDAAGFGTGGDGRVVTDVGGPSAAGDVVYHSDPAGDVIYAVGDVLNPATNTHDFVLAGYLPNGFPIPGFGEDIDGNGAGDGFVRTDFGNLNSEHATALAVQSDGKIVVVGRTEAVGPQSTPTFGFVVARYNSDGSLDTTFDSDGKKIIELKPSGIADAHDVVIHNDRILIVGSAADAFHPVNNPNPFSKYFALVQLDLNGNLDAGFGGTDLDGNGTVDPDEEGIVLQDFSLPLAGFSTAEAVTIDAQDRILVAGTVSATKQTFGVGRFNADGSLDNGDPASDVDSSDRFGGVDTDADGTADVFGLATADFGVAAIDFNGDGIPDFFDPIVSRAFGLTVQTNSQIILAGFAAPSSSFEMSDFALARFLADGSALDDQFGEDIDGDGAPDGVVTTDFALAYSPAPGFTIDRAFAVALQGGKIVAAGQADNNFPDIALARYDTITIADNDNDGVLDNIEDGVDGDGDGVPDGDGNQDGTPDRDDACTASLPNAVNGDHVTITLLEPRDASGNCASANLTGVSAVLLTPPTGVTLPVGAFEFSIKGLVQGGFTRVEMIVHSGLDPTATYYRFGPTPVDAQDHWYEFVDDGSLPPLGAEPPIGNSMIIQYLDGTNLSDSDLAANGTVIQLGGPAIVTAPPPQVSGLKFHDINGNGVLDTGEPRLAGWEIFLDLNGNGQLDANEPSDVTDENGEYSFTSLPSGAPLPSKSLRVMEVLDDQPGWYQTSPRPFSFAGHVNGPFSLTPLESGDVNLDGKLDLVALSFGNNVSEFQVLSGNGDGSFLDPISYDTGLNGQYDAELSDLNGDTLPDLIVVGEFGPHEAAVLYDFNVPIPLDVPGGDFVVRDVAVGDVDGAGDLDIIFPLLDSVQQEVRIVAVLNDGTQSFAGATIIEIATLANSFGAAVVVGDWDGDGDADVAVTHDAGVTVYQNNSGVAFTSIETFDGAGAFEAVDADGDGDLDLVGPGTVLRNDAIFVGDVSFTRLEAPIPSGRLTTFELGGNPALSVIDPAGDTMTLLVADGSGSFRFHSILPVSDQPADPTFGHDPRDVAAGDFNGDGEDDLAFALFVPDEISILLRDTTPAHVARLGEEPISANVNFGNRTLSDAQISGALFEANKQGDVVGPLVGETILIDYDNDGVFDGTTMTDATGQYSFTNLLGGTYVVQPRLSLQAWKQTDPVDASGDPVPRAIGIADDETIAGQDFTLVAPPVIEGRVGIDVNGIRALEPSEPPLAGWRVFLDLDGSGTFDAATEPARLTDADGFYSFEIFSGGGLSPGTYQVRQSVPQGWTQIFPEEPFYDLTLEHGDIITADFGNQRDRGVGSINGTKWRDLNGDGTRNTDPVTGAFLEPGLEDWTIYIDTNVNGELDPGERSTVTDASGFYEFPDLPAESAYLVSEVLQDGWLQTFPEPTSPHQVQGLGAVADMDVDGDLDFATIEDGQVRILLNGGNGTYFPGGTFPAGDSPTSIRVAHLNGDDLLDLIVANSDADQITVLLANPAGSFVNVAYDVGDNPVSIATGDLDGDGDIDLAVSNRDSQDLTILDNDGQGGFPEADRQTIALPPDSGSVVAYDRDGDGDLDLTLLNFLLVGTSHLTHLENLGGGVFGAPEIDQPAGNVEPFLLTALDVDQDTRTDGALVLYRSVDPGDFVSTVLGLGLDVSFAVQNHTLGPVAAADLTGDGRLDGIAIARRDGNTSILVALDGGNNHYDLGASLTGLATGDVDRDGDVDILTLAAGQLAVLRNRGDGTFELPKLLASHNVLVSAGQTETRDLGNARRGAIAGTVWNDFDANGQRDPGEAGVPNWTVFLDDNGDGVLNNPGAGQDVCGMDAVEQCTLTDSNGDYAFTGLIAGTYTVAQVLPSDLFQSFPSMNQPHQIELGAEQIVSSADFGIYMESELIGLVFDDGNANGIHDPGEPVQEGRMVLLDVNEDGVLSDNEPFTRTDSNGQYRLSGLAPGRHTVTLVHQPGWGPTTAGTTVFSFDLGASAVGPVSSQILAVDLNDDEFPDLVALTNNSVFVLLNDRFGTFPPQGNGLAVQGSPEQILAVDLNGDGSPPDLVTQNLDFFAPNDVVSVLLNDGSGAFPNPSTNSTVVDDAQTLLALDLTADGSVDLLISNMRSFSPNEPAGSVLLNNGNDAFPPQATNLVFDENAKQLLAVDLNADGRPDLVTRNDSSDNVSVLLNDRDGMFPGPATYSAVGDEPNQILVLNLNDDEFPDLVTANTNSDNVSVLLNDGNGAFPAQAVNSAVGELPRQLMAVDLNADQFLDLVIRNRLSDDVSVLLNNRDGTFPAQATNVAVGDFPIQLLAIDLNGDEFVDLVTQNSVSDTVSVLLNNGDGTFPAQTTYLAIDASQLLAVDLNGDDVADLVTRSGGSVNVRLNNGDGVFPAQATNSAVTEGTRDLLALDLNGDEFPDLVSLSAESIDGRDTDRLSVLLNNGDGTFPMQAIDFVVGGKLKLTHDLNRDTRIDFAFAVDDTPQDLVIRALSTASTRIDVDVSGILGADATVVNFGSQPDFDLDGVTDALEDAAPNSGDGNGDGTADSKQANVASLPNSADGGYVTLVSPPGTRLVDIRAVDPASIGNLPPGATFPLGLFDFTVDFVDPNESVTVNLIDHTGHAATSYFKYGPTPDDASPHWYDFTFDGSTGFQNAGLQLFSLTFVNGERGDSDLDPNNTAIVDPGGPAVLATNVSLDLAGPASGVRGQPLAFTFSADPTGDYSYDVDWDGDGTVDQSLAGSETLTAEHIYPAEGNFSVMVTAINTAGGGSANAAHDVSIDVAAVIDGNLLVGGTSGDDQIKFKRKRGKIVVDLNGQRLGPFALDQDARLIAFGQEGDDRISASILLRHDAEFFGGGGDDRLRGARGNDLLDGGPGDDHLSGLGGDDVLLGGAGNDKLLGMFGNNVLVGAGGDDHLVGGLGRDVLIGGTDRDRLFGLFGQDILIAGSTVYDDNEQALRDILAEWTAPRPYAARIDRLCDVAAPVYLKKDDTVLDDDSVDWLYGGPGLDWFLLDRARDKLFANWPWETLN